MHQNKTDKNIAHSLTKNQHDVLTMSKCMLPPLERGIAAMLTRRADDCQVKKIKKNKIVAH